MNLPFSSFMEQLRASILSETSAEWKAPATQLWCTSGSQTPVKLLSSLVYQGPLQWKKHLSNAWTDSSDFQDYLKAPCSRLDRFSDIHVPSVKLSRRIFGRKVEVISEGEIWSRWQRKAHLTTRWQTEGTGTLRFSRPCHPKASREKHRVPTHLVTPGKKPPRPWLSLTLAAAVCPHLAHCREQIIQEMSAPHGKTHYLFFNTSGPFHLKPLFLYT